MRGLFFAALMGFVAVASWAEDGVVLGINFDSPETKISGDGVRVPGHGGTMSLRFQQREGMGSAMSWVEVPVESIVGRLISVSALVRAEGVSAPPRSWNGIKVMLVLDHGEGKSYLQVGIPHGDFDWTAFRRTIRVPKRIVRAQLGLGLEQVGGTVWFDDVSIRTSRPMGGTRLAERFKGHDLPRLRGVMYGPEAKEEDIRVLAEEWGANQVRLQINWTPMKQAEVWARDLEAYRKWLDETLPHIDRALEYCEKCGLKVLLDLHCPPGGRIEGGVCPLFSRKDCQDAIVEIWEMLARRYKDRPCIYAYDLLNEPVEPQPGPGVVRWPDLFVRVAKAIRAIDPGKPLVFEPGPWGGCDGFDEMAPLDLDRVIYSFHMYKPHAFTHQGLHANPVGPVYPGVIAGEYWDKPRLREAMAPAIDFQETFNAHMYVGEFSAIRWAPDGSAYRYLRDCIALFEELGWDWSYHAYREASVWDVEHGPDRDNRGRAEGTTDRKRLLLEWFEKNGKAGKASQ